MPVKIITKQVFECTCACPSHPECSHKVKPWTTDKIPVRCAGCMCRTWNRKSRLTSKKPPLTFNGETLTIPEWTRKLGLSKFAIPWRIKQGWPLEQVLSSEDWRLQK